MVSTIIRIWKVHYKIIIWKKYNNSNKDDKNKNDYDYSNFIGYASYIPSNLENFEDKSSHLEVLKRYLQVLRPSRLGIGGRNEVSPYRYDQSKSAQWIISGKLTLCY